jgi:hypothetical protein
MGVALSGRFRKILMTNIKTTTPCKARITRLLEGKFVRVEKETIEERRKGNSAMPADIIKQLSQVELRDLVAYLASLKGHNKVDGHSLTVVERSAVQCILPLIT